MLVATNGYIFTALGSYLAGSKNSDAKITEHTLMNNSEDIINLFKERDVLIVDKGFRDVAEIHVVNECDIKTAMSHLLKNLEKQHSTEEANESRLVGRRISKWTYTIKQLRDLSNVLPNSLIPFAGDYGRIV